jgi:hypothetical protein
MKNDELYSFGPVPKPYGFSTGIKISPDETLREIVR